MPTTTYSNLYGEILGETRGGVERDYLPDPLGSTAALLDTSQAKTDTFAYWPYGEERTRTGTTDTPFRFVGTLGYYRDDSGRTYVRARHYLGKNARWLTVDPLWPLEKPYQYSRSSPTSLHDPTGLKSCLQLMTDAKGRACNVFKKKDGPNCVRECIKKCWGGYSKTKLNCLRDWCSKSSNITILPATGDCAVPDTCALTSAGTGSGCSIGICPQSCNGTSTFCCSPSSRDDTVIHEALHCCESGKEVQIDTEKQTSCTAKCIVQTC